MRILFVGDVFGPSGRAAVRVHLPRLIADWNLDLVIVNGENAADRGFGINRAIYEEFLHAGADVVTLGNYSWDDRSALEFASDAARLVRPVNYLDGTPGQGFVLVDMKHGGKALVVNALGQVFMQPINSPFPELDRLLRAYPLAVRANAIIVDFHCEATSEKQTAGLFCDGRASLVVGSHTHTPTADHRILPKGTGYLTDAGMTGDYQSVIGMQADAVIRRLSTGLPAGPIRPAAGEATLCGVAVETDDATGLARRIAPLRIGGSLSQARPDFW